LIGELIEKGQRTALGILVTGSWIISVIIHFVSSALESGFEGFFQFLIILITYLGVAAIGTMVAMIGVGIYAHMWPVILLYNVYAAFQCFQQDQFPHLEFYCSFAKLIGIHYGPVEWICAFITTVGWISVDTLFDLT